MIKPNANVRMTFIQRQLSFVPTVLASQNYSTAALAAFWEMWMRNYVASSAYVSTLKMAYLNSKQYGSKTNSPLQILEILQTNLT
jgi:hypothetical protein